MVETIFVLVYAGMALGRWPGLRLDRTGIALLGAISLLVFGAVTTEEAWQAIDVPTIGLLFGLMVVSAQFRLGGFYSAATRQLAASKRAPAELLLWVIGLAGLLSSVLANDVVCLAMAPVLVELCARRGLDPVPFLLGLAAGANVGSAATLIGNPQNMLIGQALGLRFSGYLLDGAVPAALGIAVCWAILYMQYRGRFRRETPVPDAGAVPLDLWQTAKGLLVLGAAVAMFLHGGLPREVVALAAAGILLMSRRLHSREMLGLVDWQLLVLFAGLFVVHAALTAKGTPQQAMHWLYERGVDIQQPAWLFAGTVVASNVVSNVPAVMLLLPAATHPQAGAVLALASTLAGNLLLVGSIANLIVVEQAGRLGVAPLTGSWFRTHLRSGLPITLCTLALAAGWLALRA